MTPADLLVVFLVVLMATAIFAAGMAFGDWNATR